MAEAPLIKSLPDTNRPYAPPSNLTDVLGRLRSRNVPEKANMEYLRDVGVSEGTLARVFSALRFLDLVETDGTPSPKLRSMAVSTDEEYRSSLAAIIREKYADVFASLDPAQDPQDRFINYFRRYTPGSQRDRMVIFFLGLCREAGIPTLDAPRQRTSQVGSRPRAMKTTLLAAGKAAIPSRTSQARQRGETTLERGSLPPALEMLIRSLPPLGTPFPEDRREQWLAMAKVTLEFVYTDTYTNTANVGAPEDDNEDEVDLTAVNKAQ